MKLRVSGFKGLDDNAFDLNKITVLAGSNSAGKSSLIQAVLLARTALERNTDLNKQGNYNPKYWKNKDIGLNDSYCLNLGANDSVFTHGSFERKSEISIEIEHHNFLFNLPLEEDYIGSLKASYRIGVRQNKRPNNAILKGSFYYLNAERIGPQYSHSKISHSEFIHCGHNGENTAFILSQRGYKNIEDDRVHDKDLLSKLLIDHVSSWMTQIFENIYRVQLELHKDRSASIQFLNKRGALLAGPAVGFGVTYALPIIVNGLNAKKGSFFIVENPEAHLHPKAQSLMGYFLGMLASAGLQVIVETHSEHIINGIRRFVFTEKKLISKELTIYFFKESEIGDLEVDKLELNDRGSITPYPLHFFDQVSQDMAEITRAIQMIKNG